jgi:quercetin dioxygenase-like cupin family protein
MSMRERITTGQSGPERGFILGELRATILTTGAETGGRHDLVHGALPPGATTPLHVHTRYEERLWVLSGSLTVWAGPYDRTLRAGDFQAIPRDVPHTIQAGPEGVEALNISSPAGFADLVARAGTPAELATAENWLDAERLTAVTAELGDLLLGPPGTIPADLAAGAGSRPALRTRSGSLRCPAPVVCQPKRRLLRLLGEVA